MPLGLLLLDLLHRREQQLAALDTDNTDAHGVVVDLIWILTNEILEVLHGLCCEPDGTHAVHGRRCCALLEVTGYTVTGLKFALAGLGDHLCNGLNGVCLAGLFVDQDDLSRAGNTLVLPEDIGQVVNVTIQHLEVDAVLGCVDCERTDGETGDCGNVARFTTLGFDDEDTTTRGGGRLTTGVSILDEGVQTCVRTDRVFGAGDVVGDGSRHDDLGLLVRHSKVDNGVYSPWGS